MAVTQIETKELRGVSLRTLYAIIVATATIVLTVFGSYSSLKGQIKEMQSQKDSDSRYNDLRMKILEQRLDANDIQLKELSKKYDEFVSQSKEQKQNEK